MNNFVKHHVKQLWKTLMILFSQAQFQECWPPGSWQWMPSSMETPLELYPVIRHSAATWGSRYGTNGCFRKENPIENKSHLQMDDD